uniref:Histone-lysine N-methyltransferase n=1 Tax=Trichobilharzia regenti TaxID=157069 RepID=A0AA85JR78_TRIRE|nr:unnamed protein product [Trichobilharzia regenti]
MKLKGVSSSSRSQQAALREIGNNSNGVKTRKTDPTSQSSLFSVDEKATSKLHQLINFSLISKSLNLSPIHWKSVPQLHGIKRKHNSAVCGVIIKKRKRNRKIVKASPSEDTSLDKNKEENKLIKYAEANEVLDQPNILQNLESKGDSCQPQIATDGNLSEDSCTTAAVGKRQRRLTAKAAEAMAAETLRKKRRTPVAGSYGKGKVFSDDEQLGSENENKAVGVSKTVTKVAATSPKKLFGLIRKSSRDHTTPLPDKGKSGLDTENKRLDTTTSEILPSSTPIGEEYNSLSETCSNVTPILPASLSILDDSETINGTKDGSLSDTAIAEVIAEVKPLSDEHGDRKDSHPGDILQNHLENKPVPVLDADLNQNQEVSRVTDRSFSASKESEVGISNEVSDELSNKALQASEESLIQKDTIGDTKEFKNNAHNDQQQPEMNSETQENTVTSSMDDSASTPPMRSDVQSPPATKASKSKAQKRSPSPADAAVMRSKRRLKVNHRFIDDYDGYLGFMSGGRRSRASSEVSNGSEESSSQKLEQSARHSQRATKSRLLSWYDKKHSNEKVKKTNLLENSTKSSSKGYKSNDDHHDNRQEEKCSNRSVTGLKPRVKQVSRLSLNREDSRYSSTLSAMVHAARLAAIGAKVPGGVSPVHAALAASTAYSNRMKDKHPDSRVNGQGGVPQGSLYPTKLGGTSQNTAHLPKRCGQCDACLGLTQPCGKCNDCRLVSSNDPRGRPCKELICFRRRAAAAAAAASATEVGLKSGPRVKFPSNHSSPSPNTNLPICGYKGALSTSNTNHVTSRYSSNKSEDGLDKSVSLLQTVPGLAQKLELDAWLSSDSSQKLHANGVNISYRKQRRAGNNLHVGPELQVTPIRGGDMGMHFNSNNEGDENEDSDRVRPVEGEIIDSELAIQGGYPVVTTSAAAPPKEICYVCGSGGGQMLCCVSCAEPFHFYCVERQFRPRKKEYFVCRNCTTCKVCRRRAADLRCIHCSSGYHPDCLSDFPPSQTSQRGSWTCPECSVCLHCGVKACKPAETTDGSGSTSVSTVRGSHTAWSHETTKCAACSEAESRGHVCPECKRVYLSTTKQMIQCDSCRLWMHRTCTKLTVDEYELITRIPDGQLSKFVVTCSACQKEQRSHQKFNVSRNNNNNNPNKQNDFAQQSTTDLSEDSEDNDEAVDSADSGAQQLRLLAQETLMERMSGLIQSCRKSISIDYNAGTSMNSPSSVFFHSPTASSIGKSSGLWTNGINKDEHTTTGLWVPQSDGVVESDSGDELTAAVEAAASLWDPTIEISNPISANSDHLSSVTIDSPIHPDKTSCETVLDTFSASGIPSDTVSELSHSISQPLQTDNSLLTPPVDYVRNLHNTIADETTPISHNQPSQLTVNTSLSKNESNLVHSAAYPNRRRYSSSSSSSSRQFVFPNPPINAHWLVDKESESIWTTPRSLLYRLLIRILQRLSLHPVSSPTAVALRRLLRWLSTVTESLFPWLSINEMASDVRDVLRQLDGKFSEVMKHFHERALIELHELICPVIARLNENCPCVRNPSSGQMVSSVQNITACYSRIQEHLKEHHPNYELNDSTEINSLEYAKRYLSVCKRSRCQRPHEVEMLEQMKQTARDDRWIEHWSSIEEKMVVEKFQTHLLKLYKLHLLESQQLPESIIQAILGKKCEIQPSTSQPSTANLQQNDSDDRESTQCDSETPVNNNNNTVESSSNQEIVNELKVKTENIDEDIPDSNIATQSQSLENVNDKKLRTYSLSDAERFYFALEEFWNQDELVKHIIFGSFVTVLHFVDMDNDVDLHLKMFNDVLQEQLNDNEDLRRCLLCGYHGDDNIEGRLLYTGSDTWVHVNCALWCNDVYEEDSGELIGLSDAIRRGRSSKCADCGKYGATLYCSNMKTDVCPLSILVSSNDNELDCLGAVHFSCALRRRPPLPRCVFTADRSWFCSDVCHHTAVNRRLAEALLSLKKTSKTNRDRKFGYPESLDDQSSDEEMSVDAIDPAEFVDHPAFPSIERAVTDDLEPIGLGDLLVCRRVFVASDCFAASVYPQSLSGDLITNAFLMSDAEHSELMRAAKEAVTKLAVSPYSLAFLQNNGLSANSLVITIGALRIDRLGEVREASDSLAMAKWIPGSSEERTNITRSNFLCPINYRARRIYWSCSKLDSRVPYTLHVRQNQATHASSGYMEPNSTPRLCSILSSNPNKSNSLLKTPIVNSTSQTSGHKNLRLVSTDSRVNILTPVNYRSPPHTYTSGNVIQNSVITSSNNNNSNNYYHRVKNNTNASSSVQDASKTLTAVLTNALPIVTSSVTLINTNEPTVVMSHTGGHIINNATSYSTIVPVSNIQFVNSSINTIPTNQRQMIQSPFVNSQNSSLKIVNTVSLCAQPSSQHIQQHQLPTQQYVVPIHIASQTPGKITSNVITLNSGNNKDLGYRRGVNRLIAPANTQMRINNVNMIPVNRHQLQSQQNHHIQLQQIQQQQQPHVNTCIAKPIISPKPFPSNIIPVSNSIIPVHPPSAVTSHFSTVNSVPVSVNMNINKPIAISQSKINNSTVIRIQGVHTNQRPSGLLTTPTKDVQLATQLDGLFQK